jgi:hypothetical protein
MLGRVDGHGLAVRPAMDCRIQVFQERDLRIVRVAGRLEDAQVPDLLAACYEADRAVQVDLTDVVSVDTIAVDALRRVRDAGARLVGVPKYIQLKLDTLVSRSRGASERVRHGRS